MIHWVFNLNELIFYFQESNFVLFQISLFSAHIVPLFHYFSSFFYLFNHFKHNNVYSPFQSVQFSVVLWVLILLIIETFDWSSFPHMVYNFILWAHLKQWWFFCVSPTYPKLWICPPVMRICIWFLEFSWTKFVGFFPTFSLISWEFSCCKTRIKLDPTLRLGVLISYMFLFHSYSHLNSTRFLALFHCWSSF